MRFAWLIFIFTALPAFAAFNDEWVPAKVKIDGANLFVNKLKPGLSLHMRNDKIPVMPDPKLNIEDLTAAIQEYRSAFQEMAGQGFFRTEQVKLRALEKGVVQELLKATYQDHRGQRFYLYEEQLFKNGRVAITQISSTMPLPAGLALVQKARVDRERSRRGIASEPVIAAGTDDATEAAAGCIDCVEEKTGYFTRTMQNMREAAQAAQAKDREEVCSKVKKEKRSMLSGVIGETEYKSWDEQFNTTLSNTGAARSAFNCLAAGGVDFVKGLVEPFIFVAQLGWSGVSAVSSFQSKVIRSIYSPSAWKRLYERTKKLPDNAKAIVTSAATTGTAAFAAIKDPVGTGKRLGQALGRIVNSYLVNKVPEFMCLTPEAKAEMICGMVGYIAGNVVNPLVVLKLLQAGKVAELAVQLGKAFDKVGGGFFNAEKAVPSAGTAMSENIGQAIVRTETVHGADSAAAARWAQDPERAEQFARIAKFDESNVQAGLQPVSADIAKTFSRYNDPKAKDLLKMVEDAVVGGDKAEIDEAKRFMALLREEKSGDFNTALKNATEKFDKELQCAIGGAR